MAFEVRFSAKIVKKVSNLEEKGVFKGTSANSHAGISREPAPFAEKMRKSVIYCDFIKFFWVSARNSRIL